MNQTTADNARRPDKKVVVLGDVGVGKTALLRRYLEGTFIPNTPKTLGVCCNTREWNGSVIALWDTTGQEGLSSLVPLYLKKANAAILCFSIENRESFESIEKRHSRLLKNNVADDCVVILVGTKSDLVKERERAVSREESENKAIEYRQKWQPMSHPSAAVPYFETSSKDNENVNNVFEYVFDMILISNENESISLQDASYRDSKCSSTLYQGVDNNKSIETNFEDEENYEQFCCCRFS